MEMDALHSLAAAQREGSHGAKVRPFDSYRRRHEALRLTSDYLRKQEHSIRRRSSNPGDK